MLQMPTDASYIYLTLGDNKGIQGLSRKRGFYKQLDSHLRQQKGLLLESGWIENRLVLREIQDNLDHLISWLD